MYQQISNIGCHTCSPSDNPLTYCIDSTLDQRFLHGGHSDNYGQHSKQCQAFLSEYCAKKWDGFCEYASQHPNVTYAANSIKHCGQGNDKNVGMTAGEILIHNTAANKYLVGMQNCKKVHEPFDPLVANSPMIGYWIKDGCSSNNCVPTYSVNPQTVDSDVVMDKILVKPDIAFDILVNIYHTMRNRGTLAQLEGTKLGHFYKVHPHFRGN